MTKYLLGLVLTLIIVSCKKDDVSSTTSKKDYTSFLAKSTPTFYGKLDNETFSWTFGWNQSQLWMGYENGYGICDSIDPVRVLSFGLISESDLQTRFTLYSPRFNSESESEFSQVFSLGKKKLGGMRDHFYLAMYKNNGLYQSNSLNLENEIEILKTQEFTDNLGERIRVWFRIDAKLSSCNCPNNPNSVLADGLIVAEFYGFRKKL